MPVGAWPGGPAAGCGRRAPRPRRAARRGGRGRTAPPAPSSARRRAGPGAPGRGGSGARSIEDPLQGPAGAPGEAQVVGARPRAHGGEATRVGLDPPPLLLPVVDLLRGPPPPRPARRPPREDLPDDVQPPSPQELLR